MIIIYLKRERERERERGSCTPDYSIVFNSEVTRQILICVGTDTIATELGER